VRSSAKPDDILVGDECRPAIVLPSTKSEETDDSRPIPVDDRGVTANLDGAIRADDRDVLASESLQGSSARTSFGRAVMPRDGRRLVALVTRMHGPRRVTLVARRAIVTAGQLRIAIVARGQS
jgi:hypothetical protein